VPGLFKTTARDRSLRKQKSGLLTKNEDGAGAPLKRVHELTITEEDGDRSDEGVGWHYFGAP